MCRTTPLHCLLKEYSKGKLARTKQKAGCQKARSRHDGTGEATDCTQKEHFDTNCLHEFREVPGQPEILRADTTLQALPFHGSQKYFE